MEKKLLKKLSTMIKKRGYAWTAAVLGEYDTQALKRWIKDSHIPEGKIYKIDTKLKAERAERTLVRSISL